MVEFARHMIDPPDRLLDREDPESGSGRLKQGLRTIRIVTGDPFDGSAQST